MAFEKNYKPVDNDMCPICRRKYAVGRKLIHRAYAHEGICQDCFERIYKNPGKKRTAGYSDDTANPLTRLRPAPILENPLIFKKEYPTGYEYSMPYVTGLQLLLKMMIWFVAAGAIWAMLFIVDKLVPASETDLCFLAGRGVIAAGSALLVLQNVILLIKGLFLGMGIPRRLILLVEIVIFAVMAVKNYLGIVEFIN